MKNPGQIIRADNLTVGLSANIIIDKISKDGGKITCNAGFFKKLIAFFKGLFKSLPKVEVKPK